MSAAWSRLRAARECRLAGDMRWSERAVRRLLCGAEFWLTIVPDGFHSWSRPPGAHQITAPRVLAVVHRVAPAVLPRLRATVRRRFSGIPPRNASGVPARDRPPLRQMAAGVDDLARLYRDRAAGRGP